MVATYQRISIIVLVAAADALERARAHAGIGMRAEARSFVAPAFARWFGEKSEADAAKASATRRPTRLGFLASPSPWCPDARVATPAPLFELRRMYPPSRARATRLRTRADTSPLRRPRARAREGLVKRARARPRLHAVVATEP